MRKENLSVKCDEIHLNADETCSNKVAGEAAGVIINLCCYMRRKKMSSIQMQEL